MLALLSVVVLVAASQPCFEVRQLAQGRCVDVLVELEFTNATKHEPGLDRYPGVDRYTYAQELITAPIPGLTFDQRYWRVCFQQMWEAHRVAREKEECRAPFERTLHEKIPPARVALEAKARGAFRRFRSRDGFGALRWGMSESDIRARVPGAYPNRGGLASQGEQYGRAAELSYALLSDRLIRIDISIPATSLETAFALFESILRSSDKQLGHPFVVGDHVTWIVGQTRLEVSIVNDSEKHGVHIARHSLELEMWALRMLHRDEPGVGDTAVGQSL